MGHLIGVIKNEAQVLYSYTTELTNKDRMLRSRGKCRYNKVKAPSQLKAGNPRNCINGDIASGPRSVCNDNLCEMNVIFVLSGLLALSGLTVAQVDYANLDLSEWVKYNSMLQWTNGYTQSEC